MPQIADDLAAPGNSAEAEQKIRHRSEGLCEFLILPNWVTLLYFVAAAGLVHRQALREEEYLRGHYGAAYGQYCHRVRRYF